MAENYKIISTRESTMEIVGNDRKHLSQLTQYVEFVYESATRHTRSALTEMKKLENPQPPVINHRAISEFGKAHRLVCPLTIFDLPNPE